jgi:hypothetical protein
MTLGHTKEIDVLVLNRATARTFKVEVKTSERPMNRSSIFGPCHTWLMDERHANLSDSDLIYAFVLLDPLVMALVIGVRAGRLILDVDS